MKTLFTEKQISSRIKRIAKQINADYKNKELVLVCILKGSLIFFSDLLKQITLPVSFECIKASSYKGCKSEGVVIFCNQELSFINGKHLLIVDDIIDTGLTLDSLIKNIGSVYSPLSIKTCVLFSKKIKRDIEADYKAFDIENEFVVGYGLDYNERYRNLPCIKIYNQEHNVAH